MKLTFMGITPTGVQLLEKLQSDPDTEHKLALQRPDYAKGGNISQLEATIPDEASTAVGYTVALLYPHCAGILVAH